MKSRCKKIKFSLFFFFSALIFSIEVAAQNDEKVEILRCSRFELGYIFGGQVYNDNFMYNPGFAISHTYNLKINKRVGYGLGFGVLLFEDEKFIPLYADFIGNFKKSKSSPYVNIQLGYSIGWNENYEQLENYRFNGGMMFASGLGKKFAISDRFSMLTSVNYKHQFAQLKYESFEGTTTKERLNYDFFIISVGIIFEQ